MAMLYRLSEYDNLMHFTLLNYRDSLNEENEEAFVRNFVCPAFQSSSMFLIPMEDIKKY